MGSKSVSASAKTVLLIIVIVSRVIQDSLSTIHWNLFFPEARFVTTVLFIVASAIVPAPITSCQCPIPINGDSAFKFAEFTQTSKESGV